MLKKRIIPCLDIKDGRVVKGINFKNLIDAGDPVAQAKFYYEEGADELCFLDINASHEKRDIIYDMIKKISEVCFIPFTVGGGVKKIEDIRNILLAGADKITINSAAIKNPDLIREASEKCGSQSIVVAIDVKKSQDISRGDSQNISQNNKYEVFINGGRVATGINAIEWGLKMQDYGAGEILLTSMDRDGTKSGYDLELIQLFSSKLTIPIIASGGVGNLDDLLDGADAGADALLAASIFHFKEYSISEAKSYLLRK
jgi:cyclase